jgi:glucose-1-phosphatase
MAVQHIVLDLGGVLIELLWRQNILPLFGRELSLDEAYGLWSASPAVLAHESGRLDLQQFVSAWCTERGIRNCEEVQVAFLSLLGDLKPHAEAMLNTLGERFTLSMLSNISRAHIGYIDQHAALKHHFSRHFFSCDIGKMKPSAEVYQHLLRELRSDPRQIAFFDDTAINVEAALAAGLNAWRVDSPREIMRIIATEEIFQ